MNKKILMVVGVIAIVSVATIGFLLLGHNTNAPAGIEQILSVN